MSKRMARKAEKLMISNAGDELSKLRGAINEAYMAFNSTNDPDRLEACIFEINALQSKYSLALRNFKSLSL